MWNAIWRRNGTSSRVNVVKYFVINAIVYHHVRLSSTRSKPTNRHSIIKDSNSLVYQNSKQQDHNTANILILNSPSIFSVQLSVFSLVSERKNAMKVNREQMYTFVDFLAACGGLLGVCVGASAMSIIEIIYFLTLRLYWFNRRTIAGNVVVPVNRD